MMDLIKISKSSPDQKDSPKDQDNTTLVPAYRSDPQLEGGQYTKVGVMWNIKPEISQPKLCELLINTEPKGDTDIYLRNFYNHIKICLNVVTRLREGLLPGYHSVKRHSEFEEYYVPDCDHPSYYCIVQFYTSFVQSLLVAKNNETCVKYSMAPKAYKVVITHAHEMSGWKILSRLLHSRAPNNGGINSDVQY